MKRNGFVIIGLLLASAAIPASLAHAVTVACGQSIASAVNQAPSGSTITVTGSCAYPEYIVVTQPGQTINTTGGVVTAQGIEFTSTAASGTLTGSWTFTNTSNDPGAGWGIHIAANGTTVDGNAINVDGVCFEGIYVEPSISGVTISGVAVNHAMIAGIHLDGTSTHLTHFRITNVLEHQAGCVDQTGADYINLANSGAVGGTSDSGGEIGFGYMDGTARGSPDDQETTTISCFANDGEPAIGWLIHDNICYFGASDYGNANESAAELDASISEITDITFWNNIFGHMTRGVDIATSTCTSGANCASLVNVIWQTFIDVAEEGVIYRGATGMVQSNIFYNLGSGGDDFGCALDNAVVAANVFYNPGGSYGTYCGPWPSQNVDPHFPSTSYGTYNVTTSLPAGFHAQ